MPEKYQLNKKKNTFISILKTIQKFSEIEKIMRNANSQYCNLVKKFTEKRLHIDILFRLVSKFKRKQLLNGMNFIKIC